MSASTEVGHIKAARKEHRCDWCAEKIEVGGSYKRWRWYGDGDAATCRLHDECHVAMREAYDTDPYMEGFLPGENPRGCNCGFTAGCEQCGARKAAA